MRRRVQPSEGLLGFTLGILSALALVSAVYYLLIMLT